MPAATVTSKGRITIPADVRRDMNVVAGDRVEFVQVAPARYELIAATRSVSQLKGLFGKSKRRVSVEEMNAAIAERLVRAGSVKSQRQVLSEARARLLRRLRDAARR
jgi:antitoxin PrlF